MSKLFFTMIRIITISVLLAVVSPVNHVQAQNIPSEITNPKQYLPPKIGEIPNKTSYEVPQIYGKKIPKGSNKIFFILRGVEISGNIILTNEDLKETYEKSLNKGIPITTIYEIASRITKIYRDQGYGFSGAIIPQQRIKENGVLKINVIEAFINNYKIENVPERFHKQMKLFLNKISSQKPLNVKTLERYLLILNDHSGIKVRSVLSRAKDAKDGAMELTLIGDVKNYSTNISVNNEGSQNLGQYRSAIGANYNHTFGLGNRTSLSYGRSIQNSELQTFYASQDLWIGSEGLKLSIDSSIAKTKTGGEFKDLDIRGDSISSSLNLSYPIILSRKHSLRTALGINVSELKIDVLEENLIDDRLRSLSLAFNYSGMNPWKGFTSARISGHQGIDKFGAKNNAAQVSRFDGQTDFTIARGGISNIQSLKFISPRLSFYSGISGQYAFTQLLSTQEFSVGGPNIGRGYDAGEISGDHGFGGSLELRYNVAKQIIPKTTLKLYGFYDEGRTWEIDDNTGSGSSKEKISSFGAGVRASSLNNTLHANLYIAAPIDDISTRQRKSSRIFANIQYLF